MHILLGLLFGLILIPLVVVGLPILGGLLGGVWGFAIGLLIVVGIAYGGVSGSGSSSSGDTSSYYPPAPTCLRCGGTGRMTASDGRYAGYQCEKCKRFWKTRLR